MTKITGGTLFFAPMKKTGASVFLTCPPEGPWSETGSAPESTVTPGSEPPGPARAEGRGDSPGGRLESGRFSQLTKGCRGSPWVNISVRESSPTWTEQTKAQRYPLVTRVVARRGASGSPVRPARGLLVVLRACPRVFRRVPAGFLTPGPALFCVLRFSRPGLVPVSWYATTMLPHGQ